VLVILNFSYLTAMAWLILCKFVEDSFLHSNYLIPEEAEKHSDTFIVTYGL